MTTMVDSQERLGMGNIDPTARMIGMVVIGAVVLLAVLSRTHLAGGISASGGIK